MKVRLLLNKDYYLRDINNDIVEHKANVPFTLEIKDFYINSYYGNKCLTIVYNNGKIFHTFFYFIHIIKFTIIF